MAEHSQEILDAGPYWKVLAAVSRLGSFTRAAESLDVTQPAISAAMKVLEKVTGVPLYETRGRGIMLTQAGQMLADYAIRLELLCEEAREAIHEVRGMRRGRLAIGASTAPGVYAIPQEMGRFKELHPLVEMSLEIADSQQIALRVLEYSLDLGVVGERDHPPGLTVERYRKDRLVLVVGPKHRFAQRESVSIDDLSTERFIVREDGSSTRDTVEKSFREHGLKMQVDMVLGSTEAIKRAVIANLGVSVLSDLTIEAEVKSGQLHPLVVKGLSVERWLQIIWVTGRRLPTAAAAFMEMARSGIPAPTPAKKMATSAASEKTS